MQNFNLIWVIGSKFEAKNITDRETFFFRKRKRDGEKKKGNEEFFEGMK